MMSSQPGVRASTLSQILYSLLFFPADFYSTFTFYCTARGFKLV